MGFLSRACPLTRYKLQEAPSKEQLRQVTESLARRGFRSIDTLPDAWATGWVNFDDPTDSEWRTTAPERLAHFVFTLRHDERKVPPQLLDVRFRAEVKKFLERRKAELLEKVLIPYVNKDDKLEIYKRVHASLMSRAAPVPTMTDVVWINPVDAAQAEVWLCSTTAGTRDKFTELFSKTFGLRLFPVTPWTPQPEDACFPPDIGQQFLTWLYGHDGDSLDVLGTEVAINFEKVVIADSDKKLTITAIMGETDPEEVKQGIESQMLVTECDLLLNLAGEGYRVRVKGSDFSMRVETKFWTMDREDPDGSFADKVLPVESFFGKWDELYRLWLLQKGFLPKAEMYRPAAGVERLAKNALAMMPGLKSVSKIGDGSLDLHFKDGSSMNIKKGGA